MRAAVATKDGLQVREVPIPRPKANEILVQVRAASLNRADLAVAAGHQNGLIGDRATSRVLKGLSLTDRAGLSIAGSGPA
jgi:NADPH:quinone reductase